MFAHRFPLLFIALLGWSNLAAFEVVDVQAPLTTVVEAPQPPPPGVSSLEVTMIMRGNAHRDLGVGAWLSDHHGLWYQVLFEQPLQQGVNHLHFPFTTGRLAALGHDGHWTAQQASLVRRGGLFFYATFNSTNHHPRRILIDGWRYQQGAAADQPVAKRIHGLQLPLAEDGSWSGQTGERQELHFQVQPEPRNPYAGEEFQAQLLIAHENGQRQRVPAFWKQPMALSDAGNRQAERPAGRGHWSVRYRPRLPGRYRLQLEVRWDQDEPEVYPLPDLQISGKPWDDYVRVDAEDPRFFTVDGAFFWPLGLNLHSITDRRGVRRIGHQPTPMRGTLSYAAYLKRLAAAGGTVAEIWMSNWNLALEWRADWPHYQGLGRYAQGNAQRLDEILDLAYDLGVRINLVINNHGQVSQRTNREWQDNPYNEAIGGFLQRAADYFHDARAAAYQDRYRRYLIARYSDHPAILGWKLSSEINLTAGRGDDLRAWHERAATVFAELDGYRHPITTHWSGDYRTPDRRIVAQDGIDYVTINAYRRGRDQDRGSTLARHIANSTLHSRRGLARYHKPVLVSEYGGSHLAGSADTLLNHHRTGPWAAMVSGHGGGPLFWWFEWIDQNDLWAPYRALTHFLDGEDLRGERARSVILADNEQWWSRAWVRPGRILGYVINEAWQSEAEAAPELELPIGSAVAPGELVVEWWDADRGIALGQHRFRHPGGSLVLQGKGIRQHRAFKLWRVEDADAESP